MSLHETFTSNQGLAFLLGPPRPDFNLGNTWFGSVSIWAGPIIGFSPAGNAVIEVAVSGIPGVTAIQAEVFGTRSYDNVGLASVAVTHIEWSLPGSSTVLASYTFANPVPFPLSLSRNFNPPIYQFVDILNETIFTFGGTPQTLFDDYFNGADTLTGGAANDIMHGGNGFDVLEGGGGIDTLLGNDGSDTFVYRTGDAAAGESIYGGAALDGIRTVGAVLNGDINQAGGVDLRSVTLSSVEELNLNGTEAVVTAAQIAAGLTIVIGRTNFADQLTIDNVSSINLANLSFFNWEPATDRVAVLGTDGADSVNGQISTDLFVGFAGADTFAGGGGDDRLIVVQGDATPNDSFAGGTGNDVLQVDSTAIGSVSVTPNTDLRGMILSSVEVLDIVQGAFFVDGADFLGSIGGTNAAPVTATTGFHTVIGNDSAGIDTPIVLQLEAGSLLGVDLRGVTFQDWNDGFTNNNLIRIIAGPQTQVIYGANEFSRIVAAASTIGVYIQAGSDTDEIIGSNREDYILSGGGDDLVHSQGGDDLIDASTGHDLAYGGNGNDSMGGAEGNDSLYGDLNDDFMVGGIGNDYLDGGEGYDILNGGAGADALYGGGLADFASYNGSTVGVRADLSNAGTNTGDAAGDTYSAIEGLQGSSQGDTLVGNADGNTLRGENGADRLEGGGGADHIFGGATADSLYGDAGGDHLWGGAGADAHYGGTDAGVDYARYDDANHGNLVIRMDAPASNTGAAAGDTYSGIEGLVGGAGNDTVYGDGLANYLFGAVGNDHVYGGGGADYLSGDGGGDNLWGGTGADAHYGGTDAGIDYARYDDANHGDLTIRLDAPTSNAGAAAVGDTYSGIEGLVGGAGNDVVIGNNLANYLFGSGGSDYIDALNGNDYLNGGAGADRFRFSTALGAGNVDSIADFQVGVDDMLLAQAIFAAIGTSLTTDEFRIGMAQDGNDFLLYNPGTGQLFYDSNANAAGGMVHFATVTANTALTFSDFVMV